MAHIRILDYDIDSYEATLEIIPAIPAADRSLFVGAEDLDFSVISFAYPGKLLNHEQDVSLFAFLVTDIFRESCLKPPIKTNAGFFSYRIFAKVQNSRDRHVRLGDINIFLDMPLPKDIADNDIVSFDVHRLDYPGYTQED